VTVELIEKVQYINIFVSSRDLLLGAWLSASTARIHGKIVVPPSNYQIGTVINGGI
jgi:hypothetical protein